MKKTLLAILTLFIYVNADITTPEGAKRACDLGKADGCSNLGYMYEYGKGVKQSYYKALEQYKKACNMESIGNAFGCYNLGYMYNYGKGVKKIILKLKNYLKKLVIWEIMMEQNVF